jgi:hypothetical protein
VFRCMSIHIKRLFSRETIMAQIDYLNFRQ